MRTTLRRFWRYGPVLVLEGLLIASTSLAFGAVPRAHAALLHARPHK